MSEQQLSVLQKEWSILQTQFDEYEKYSLLIKLFNITLTCYLLFVLNIGCWSLFICALVWLQDGIWKTFQARIGERLEVIESGLSSSEVTEKPVQGMQFNSAWAQSRKGAVGLIAEYIKQSLKPTVAYPHLLLVIMVIVQHLSLL
ncbi:hypothetical protein [Paraglaciecola sp.]|uniref:hypothetical protein n=1 Tax=Paraglaciecola sp. TaxID=1920173 RepID=UPI003EF97CD4